jgi:hypothetical protein
MALHCVRGTDERIRLFTVIDAVTTTQVVRIGCAIEATVVRSFISTEDPQYTTMSTTTTLNDVYTTHTIGNRGSASHGNVDGVLSTYSGWIGGVVIAVGYGTDNPGITLREELLRGAISNTHTTTGVINLLNTTDFYAPMFEQTAPVYDYGMQGVDYDFLPLLNPREHPLDGGGGTTCDAPAIVTCGVDLSLFCPSGRGNWDCSFAL